MAEQRRSQSRWNWRSQRNQLCSTGAVADHVFSETISTGTTRVADETPPEAPDVEMGAEEPCEAQVKRAKTIMGEEMCVLEAQERRRTRLKAWRDCDRRRHSGARSDTGAESTENAGQSLPSPDRRSADASEVRVQSEDQRTAG